MTSEASKHAVLRRASLVLLVALVMPVIAAAQTNVGLPRISGQLPPIGLPLPSITPRLAPIGIPTTVDGHRAILDGSDQRGHVPGRRHGSSKGHVRLRTAVVYFAPAYFWSGPHASLAATPKPTYLDQHPRPGRSANTGVLRLAVEPAALVQIYVDGFFTGTSSDFNGELELDAGTHRIELRGEGYQTISFDVSIEGGRTITYRASLQPLTAAPAPAPASQTAPPADAIAVPSTPTTVYLIPGCYLGNVPPEEARLPANCDKSKVTTFEP